MFLCRAFFCPCQPSQPRHHCFWHTTTHTTTVVLSTQHTQPHAQPLPPSSPPSSPAAAGGASASATPKLDWTLVNMPVPYGVPEIQDNPDGWGPCSVPEHLEGMPFAPFSKGDKLGKAADWTQQAYQKYPGTCLYRGGTGCGGLAVGWGCAVGDNSRSAQRRRPWAAAAAAVCV